MRLKPGDCFKFYKPKHNVRLFGQITEIRLNKFYAFRVLGCNIPKLLGAKMIFLVDGKIKNYITKVKKEEVIEGLIKQKEI